MSAVSRRTASGLLLLAAFGAAQSTAPESAGMKRFLDWANTLPPDSFPETGAALLDAYRARLIRDRRTPEEAGRVVAEVRSRITQADDNSYQTLFYNKTYEMTEPTFSVAPNEFLVEVSSRLKPGKALDLGMGEGRNSIFLAQHGWDVTGIDLSEVGVRNAKKRAASLGVRVNAILGDANRLDFGNGVWDLLCMIYFSGYYHVRDIEKRIAAGLKKDGYAISEGPVPSPKGLADLWAAYEPLGFRLARLEYRADKADWGQPFFGRLLMQKR